MKAFNIQTKMKNTTRLWRARKMNVSAIPFHTLEASEMNVIYCMSAFGILSV